MTGPFGRFCFPLMKNVANATYSANIISTAKKTQKHHQANQGSVLESRTTEVGCPKGHNKTRCSVYDLREQVLALAECQYKKKEGEDEPVDEDEKLGHKSPHWKDWKWDGDKVIVSKDLKVEKTDIRRAAEDKNLKFGEWADVYSLRK